ncbi:MAG: hypothetical protein Q7R93_01080 [bacterium]|nr:hypothetical protein [bacterium]
MAIYFLTNTPNKLLSSFKKAIDDSKIITWSYDQDGDFTHATDQWKNRAWFRPEVKSDRLAFFIIKPQSVNISATIYAIYHGRFLEAMLAHFDTLFTASRATSMPEDKDNI